MMPQDGAAADDEEGDVSGLPSLEDLYRDFGADAVGVSHRQRDSPGHGASLTVELAHRDIATLDRASEQLASSLERFANVKDIDDGYTPGKQQLDFKMLPEARAFGDPRINSYVDSLVRNDPMHSWLITATDQLKKDIRSGDMQQRYRQLFEER